MLLELATALNVLVGAAVAIAGLVQPDLVLEEAEPKDSRTLLLYLAARNVGLAVVTFTALLAGPPAALVWLAVLAGSIQLIDLYVALQTRNKRRAGLALVLTVLQFGALGLTSLAG